MLALALVVGVDHFAPAPRGSDWFMLDSLRFGSGAGLVATWAVRPLVVYNAQGVARGDVVAAQLVTHVGGALTVLDRARIAVDLPAALHQRGDGATLGTVYYPPPASAALGDLHAALDVRLLPALAVGASLAFPTGGDYLGGGEVRAEAQVLAAGDVGPVALAGRVAAGSEVELGGAVGVRGLAGRLLAGVELSATTSAAELLVGAHWAPLPGLVLGAGAGPGIGHAAGTPAARVVISIEWRR
jgi:hypothetical protein